MVKRTFTNWTKWHLTQDQIVQKKKNCASKILDNVIDLTSKDEGFWFCNCSASIKVHWLRIFSLCTDVFAPFIVWIQSLSYAEEHSNTMTPEIISRKTLACAEKIIHVLRIWLWQICWSSLRNLRSTLNEQEFWASDGLMRLSTVQEWLPFWNFRGLSCRVVLLFFFRKFFQEKTPFIPTSAPKWGTRLKGLQINVGSCCLLQLNGAIWKMW